MTESASADKASEKLFKTKPLLFYIKQNRRSFTLGMIFLLITNSIDTAYPLFIRQGVDLVASNAPMSDISKVAGGFFIIMVLLAMTRYMWRRHFGQYHTDAAEDLRNRIFTHLTTMGPNFFKKNPIGELLSIIINDVQSFRTAIGSGVLMFVDGVIIICLTLPVMLWLNPQWTWRCLILLPTVPLLIKYVTKKIFTTYKIQQDQLAQLSGVSQEIVAGIRVIKSFGLEEPRLQKYNEQSRKFERASNRTAAWDSMFMPTMEFGIASGSVILLFVAGHDVLSGLATVGTLVAFQRYIQKMTWPMTALGGGFSQFQKGMASFARITEMMQEKTDIPDEGKINLQQFQKLEVRNLSYQFADSDHPVLQNLNFRIQAGQFVGIVGPVGSGKTTLFHLLNRLYPATHGSILLNGHSIEEISQESLRKTISMVPQEAFLFSESIADNMSFGLTELPDHDQLIPWALAVDIENEISSLPFKYATQLGERGVNLSGGQKQRLTIARALITKAPVVMLDDSLSAVDTKTEKNIKQAIESMTSSTQGQRKTRIIIAHRLGSVENADQIIVLNHGNIEAIGTHTELLKTSPTYRQMAANQSYTLPKAEVAT